MKPPLLPSEILRRVMRVARSHGTSVLVLSGGFALLSAASRDVSGAVIGLLVAGAGALELHGVTLLRLGHNGLRWLVGGQLFLMASILAYVGLRIARPDVAWMLPYVKGEAADPIIQAAQQQGVTVEQLLATAMTSLYMLVAALTIICQGSIVIYYLRRRTAVAIALQELDSQ
jgi:hypothetical protein